MNSWIKNVQTWVYPPQCVLCDATGGADLCRGCRADLPAITASCYVCALPLEDQRCETGSLICGACQRRPPPFQRTLAPCIYAPPLDRLIQQFKFNRRLHLARPLAELMMDQLRTRSEPCPQRLVPVPLHPQRLRQRGFNQARELARVIGRELGISLAAPEFCQRLRATPPQVELPARQRRRNLRGAFAVTSLSGLKHVAIVDDVMTTGHTVAELARMLRRASVETIEVWVCARALPPGY